MVFIDRFCGIDSIAISRVDSIGVDYSAFVPVSCAADRARLRVKLGGGK